MRRVAHLLCLCVFVSGVCGIALIVSVTPAAADDCKQQVKSFSDLTDEKKLQDCLRTGSQYGRAIGTIVAGSGIIIAGVGLAGSGPSRKPKESPPPEKDKDPAAEPNPCERMKLRELRVNQLEAERVKREAQILQEWHQFMDTASFLQNTWRELKHAQTRTYWAIVSARTANFAGLGVVLVGTIAAIKAGLAGMAARATVASGGTLPAATAPTFIAAWAGAIASAEGALGAIAAETLPPNVPGPKPFTDPFASEIGKTMHDALAKVANQYTVHAREFNRAFAQWGIDTQQDITQIRADTQTEIEQWRLDAADCPNASPPAPQPPQQDLPITTLNVIRVPEDVGSTWIGGDWFRFGKGDVF
jgi:hypothetical protein